MGRIATGGVLAAVAVFIMSLLATLWFRGMVFQPSLSEAEKYRNALLHVYVKDYIVEVEWLLENQPDISNEEFRSRLRSKEFTGQLLGSGQFWKSYRIQVCPDKEAWVKAMKARSSAPLVIVSVRNKDGTFDEIGRFTYQSASAAPDEEVGGPSFIQLW